MTFLLTDAFDYVSVAIQKASSGVNSHISCTFTDSVPPMESKQCNFWSGPVADNCNDLPHEIPGTVMGSNIIHIADFDLTFMLDTTRICIALEAFSGNESWIMVGIYEIDDIIPTSPSTSETSRSSYDNFVEGSSARAPILSTSIYGLVVFKCILALMF